MTLESSIEREFVRYCKSHGAVCLKQNPNWYKNIPDRLVMLPGHRAFFIELKRPGEEPRPGQRKMLRRLQRMGHKAYYADSLHDAKMIFNAEFRKAQPVGELGDS